MKKIVFAVIAMLSVTAGFAANEKDATVDAHKYVLTVNAGKMSRTLGLNANQFEAVANGEDAFAEETLAASRKRSDDERQASLHKAVMRNLKYMQGVLDRDQYRKYVMLLNVTLANRGLSF